jgi:3-oxoacyl-[acyl-carrier protein] reductase
MRDEFFKEQAQSLGITPDEAREKRYQGLSADIPLGYAATAKEIADMVSFLVSSKSDYLTGQAFNVTGGYITS